MGRIMNFGEWLRSVGAFDLCRTWADQQSMTGAITRHSKPHDLAWLYVILGFVVDADRVIHQVATRMIKTHCAATCLLDGLVDASNEVASLPDINSLTDWTPITTLLRDIRRQAQITDSANAMRMAEDISSAVEHMAEWNETKAQSDWFNAYRASLCASFVCRAAQRAAYRSTNGGAPGVNAERIEMKRQLISLGSATLEKVLRELHNRGVTDDIYIHVDHNVKLVESTDHREAWEEVIR